MDESFKSFTLQISAGNIEIYNEFSLQHELGIYLRNILPNKKVQFERNVSYFGLDKTKFVKKEIDISIFEDANSPPETVIELKYPRNGQYPEQMFSFCKDISFVEQLKNVGVHNAYVFIFAEHRLFYEGRNQDGIYGFFRGEKSLSGLVRKPTGKKDSEIFINGTYAFRWLPVKGTLRYTIIKV